MTEYDYLISLPFRNLKDIESRKELSLGISEKSKEIKQSYYYQISNLKKIDLYIDLFGKYKSKIFLEIEEDFATAFIVINISSFKYKIRNTGYKVKFQKAITRSYSLDQNLSILLDKLKNEIQEIIPIGDIVKDWFLLDDFEKIWKEETGGLSLRNSLTNIFNNLVSAYKEIKSFNPNLRETIRYYKYISEHNKGVVLEDSEILNILKDDSISSRNQKIREANFRFQSFIDILRTNLSLEYDIPECLIDDTVYNIETNELDYEKANRRIQHI